MNAPAIGPHNSMNMLSKADKADNGMLCICERKQIRGNKYASFIHIPIPMEYHSGNTTDQVRGQEALVIVRCNVYMNDNALCVS